MKKKKPYQKKTKLFFKLKKRKNNYLFFWIKLNRKFKLKYQKLKKKMSTLSNLIVKFNKNVKMSFAQFIRIKQQFILQETLNIAKIVYLKKLI